MKFRKFDIPTPNPWKYPSRYPYFILEGPGKPLSEEEKEKIKAGRKAWRPSKIAMALYEIVKSDIGKTLLLQIENPENYYDTIDDLPKPIIADLRGAVIEKQLDLDIEFDQFYILLANPRHLNGDNIFKELDFDYEALLKPHDAELYKLNFSSVTQLSIEQVSIWKQLFKTKNG